MPAKIARSAPRPSLGPPELLVAIHTSRQSCSKAGKARIFALVWESSGESRFTSVCTVEAHEFAENIDNFAAAGASVIGISGDKIEVQRDFSTKECRDKFPVGADPSFSVI